MLLKDKVVIVSGIGPGLGQELSTLAAREGAAAVVLAARTPAKLDVAEAEILALGGATQVLKVVTDIADKDQCLALAEKTAAAFGRIDVLFNSAYDPGSFGRLIIEYNLKHSIKSRLHRYQIAFTHGKG